MVRVWFETVGATISSLPRSCRSLLFKLGCVSVLFAGLAIAGVNNASAQWKPTKPITFIVMAGKGGGADKAVRFLAKTMTERNLVDVAISPVNITGGSGAKAMTELKRRTGDDHAIMFTLNSFYTTPIRKPELAIDIGTFSPIARMASHLVARSASVYETRGSPSTVTCPSASNSP